MENFLRLKAVEIWQKKNWRDSWVVGVAGRSGDNLTRSTDGLKELRDVLGWQPMRNQDLSPLAARH